MVLAKYGGQLTGQAGFVRHHLPFGVCPALMHQDVTSRLAAAGQGHSAWVSSPQSRQRVFDVRARSDAVIVGGQTVRRDDPQLTTRRQEGHQPARIVMSRTLDLPEVRKTLSFSRSPEGPSVAFLKGQV